MRDRRAINQHAVGVCLLLFSTAILAGEQVISVTPHMQHAKQNADISFDVRYNTVNPVDESLSGLGLRLHYDSTQLTFKQLTQLFTAGVIATPTVIDDNEDHDEDPSTDKYILVAWVDVFGGQWPGEQATNIANQKQAQANEQRQHHQPSTLSLYTVHFTVTEKSQGKTTLRFTASDTSPGYALSATNVQITLR